MKAKTRHIKGAGRKGAAGGTEQRDLGVSAKDPLPFVFLNLAMTADGKIASANRAVSSFSSSYDKRLMMVLRARADAVMAGARTVDLGPVTLGPGAAKYRRMRLKRGLTEYNLRVIVSGSGTIDPGAEIFRKRYSPIIILTSGRITQAKLKRLQSVADEVKICGRREIDFVKALQWLRKKWGVRHLLCEGGGEINSGLFAAGVVDELYLTICPKIFGGRDAPTIVDGLGIENLSDATALRLSSLRRIGDELYLVYKVQRQQR
jgi:riboflavin-specific deaminase-like protein